MKPNADQPKALDIASTSVPDTLAALHVNPETGLTRAEVNDAVKVTMIKWCVFNAVAKKPVDVTPQIAKRAYELYKQRGRRKDHADQDWLQAEQEIRKDKSHK